jgi:hypothetical protein
MKGHEENLSVETHQTSLWLLRMALTRLSRFFLRILSFGIPHDNCGPVLDTVTVSGDVKGASYEELGDT